MNLENSFKVCVSKAKEWVIFFFLVSKYEIIILNIFKKTTHVLPEIFL